jgi:hypothetical protein
MDPLALPDLIPTRNGPGRRRGRDAAIRLIQGNALTGQYHGPSRLPPPISPDWVIYLAISRTACVESLHPGNGLA